MAAFLAAMPGLVFFWAAIPGLTFLLLPQVLLPFFATRGVLGLFETETFTGNMETSTFWP